MKASIVGTGGGRREEEGVEEEIGTEGGTEGGKEGGRGDSSSSGMLGTEGTATLGSALSPPPFWTESNFFCQKYQQTSSHFVLEAR